MSTGGLLGSMTALQGGDSFRCVGQSLCAFVCICVYRFAMYRCVHWKMHTYICAGVDALVCVYMCLHMCTCVSIGMHKYI